MDTYMTRVISNEKIADKIFRMELQGDIVQEMTTPGQFVNIKVNNSYEFLLRRPISICEINHEKQSFVIVYRADGAGTKIISELKEGEIVDILGPLGKGYDLDKDIIKENNREFSPDHCLLVPKEINILFKKDYNKTSNLPKGVNAVRDKFRASAYGKHIGYFDTADEAHEAFNKKRKQMIIKTALEWQDQLDQRAFDVIMQRIK